VTADKVIDGLDDFIDSLVLVDDFINSLVLAMISLIHWSLLCMKEIRSTTLQEYPNSLSYQETSLTNLSES